MFLVVGFTGLGATIVFGGKATELLVGFLIGVAAMLAELFFVLMVMFFIIGTNAANSNQSK
jgi:preprotein translocase subunit SecG